jgi:phage gpG-like protein
MELKFSDALTDLLKRLEHPERALEAVSKNLCEEAINLIKEGFDVERDPYGQSWQPKQRYDGRKTLSGPTSRLKGGWHRQEMDATGFTVAPSVKYAAYHQRGNPSLPRRMVVPDDALGLPLAWQRRFEETAEDTLKALYRP